MYNEYYPENTSTDCFENYGGHHIDDRMRARGNSYARPQSLDDTEHFATPEMIEEKRNELTSLQAEYKVLHQSLYGVNGQERMVGADLEALASLEFLAAKINDLKSFIGKAQVINPGVSDRVQMLSTVTVRVQGADEPMTLRIVGKNDSNMERFQISCSSPVGRALLGHKAGDLVDVNVGERTIRYNIISL